MKWALMVVCLEGALPGCGARSSTPDDIELAAALNTAAKVDGPLDLNSVATFSWEKVVFVMPYATPESVDAAVGFRWDGRGWMADSDHQVLAVFVDGGEVVRSAFLNRATFEFEQPATSIQKGDALFQCGAPRGCMLKSSSQAGAAAPPGAADPADLHVSHGGKAWAVYLAAHPSLEAPEMKAAIAELARSGAQNVGSGEAGCDLGAESLVPAGQMRAAAYFPTKEAAEAFAATLSVKPVGIVEVTTMCGD